MDTAKTGELAKTWKEEWREIQAEDRGQSEILEAKEVLRSDNQIKIMPQVGRHRVDDYWFQVSTEQMIPIQVWAHKQLIQNFHNR